MASRGHSGSQAAQLVHSSVIVIAMVLFLLRRFLVDPPRDIIDALLGFAGQALLQYFIPMISVG
jgi:hypothetical protein